MSGEEYTKLRRLIKFFIAIVVVFIMISLASLIHQFVDPGAKSFPETVQEPRKVSEVKQINEAELIDKIKKEIQTEIAKYPKSRDGQNGADGSNGHDGTDGVSGINGQDGTAQSGLNGANGLSNYELWLQEGNTGTVQEYLDSLHGIDGKDGQTPTFRTNPMTGNLEYKFPPDRLWTLVEGSCANITVCGVL